MAKRKFDMTKNGRDRFFRVNLYGSKGSLGMPTQFGAISLYIDRAERTLSLSDGSIITSVSLDRVKDILKEIGET